MSVRQEYVELAHRLADASAEVIRRHFRTTFTVDDKLDDSPVTIADRDSEAVMRRMVEHAFPEHGMIGEEYGASNPDAEFVWVFDPIDGTKSFITGKPLFGTLICLLHQGEPVLGMINQPISNERWLGVAEQGATLNGRRINTRGCDSVAKAFLDTTDPTMFRGADAEAFQRLERAVKLRRFGADCYAYGLLAGGWIDIVCEADLKFYDFAALIPIVREAGGIITDWSGRAPTRASDGRILACGDRRSHAEALRLLQG